VIGRANDFVGPLLNRACIKEFAEQRRMMNHVERRAETPILVSERTQGVRVGRQHPTERARLERCDV
jgi:hypothetical protein